MKQSKIAGKYAIPAKDVVDTDQNYGSTVRSEASLIGADKGYLGHFASEANLSAGHNTVPKLGSGGRFKALKAKLGNQPGIKNPGALAASIGRKKYGVAKMAKLSAAGRK